MQLKALPFPLTLPHTGKTYWLQQSLPKVERLKNSYSSRQHCQILVHLPSWRLGTYLAVEAGWLLRAPSASWFSLPIVDPTALHNKEKIKQFERAKALAPREGAVDLTAQALSFVLHYSRLGQIFAFTDSAQNWYHKVSLDKTTSHPMILTAILWSTKKSSLCFTI